MTTCPAVWLLPPGPSSCDHPSQINRDVILSLHPDLFGVTADLIAALVSFAWGCAPFDQVRASLQCTFDEACRLLDCGLSGRIVASKHLATVNHLWNNVQMHIMTL
ncbi:hypothetical protein MITS9509_01792 [Synechococcus sp. MIT S9509]|nr:hypothetical protein MITS9504_03406 [Synechococcus sp. MIT S9504]KZR91871.1 hypothetical protein MITS9509_01792 [Synechococcus sp. MIT S9509]